MTPLAFDTETALIRPAWLAPPLVCVTWQVPGSAPAIEHWSKAEGLVSSMLRDPGVVMTGHFMAFDMAVTCAQFPALIPAVFNAYRSNRVTCTKKRQQLLDIAGGVFRGRVGDKGKWIVHKYDLADLSKRHLGKPLVKDGWRLSYDQFRDYPLEQWPARAVEVQALARARRAQLPPSVDKKHPNYDEAKNLDAIIADVPEGVIRYPLEDAEVELGVFLSQEKHAEYLKDQYRQAYADFVLYLSSTWGLRTYGPGVEALRAELEEAHRELEVELQELGLVRDNGVRDMKAVKGLMIETCREYGLTLRRTDGHFKKDANGQTCADGDACTEHVSLDSDACEAVVEAAHAQDGGASDSPFMAYAEFVTLGKMLKNDVKMLSAGIEYPVHTRYDLAETGRTTSSKPNIQNLNTGRMKKGQEARTSMRLRPGVRQAFIPREGKVYIQCDFPQLELYTLAQCCYSWFGFSALGDALNAGLDPHLAFAARLLGLSYEEASRIHSDPSHPRYEEVDAARQIGKVFNFGKPGGLGDKKLIVYARKNYNVLLNLEQCKQYTGFWYDTFPDMRPHFARVSAMFGDEVERASVCTLFTERWRGGATYCAACNNGFQALGVDCAKAALCLVAEAEYVGPSPLFGSRTVAFVHDEIIAETNDGPIVHDAAFELARLMREGANRYLPNVQIPEKKMKPVAMRRWSKKAKQVFDSNKRLVPWDLAA